MSEELNLTIKCSNADKAEVTVSKNATVIELKEKISEKLSVPVAQQRLIYKGRVLKDDSTLEFYEVQDGHTVHMVKGAAPAGSAAAPQPAAASATPARSAPPPSSSGNMGNAGNTFNSQTSPFGASPFGANPMQGPPDISRMQDMLMRNPEMMQQIMSSPMMDNLMNNPDMMRDMMLNNPQMQSMLDANPQMRHILNDPAVLRQSMEMMRNPNAMREAMRSQDLAMSQLENLPGGFNALRRMYEEVQEPMMEAAAQSNIPSAGAANSSSDTSASSTSSTAPTNTAMPNPWGAPSGGQSGGANPLGQFGAFGGAGGFGGPGGGFGIPGGPGGMGGMNPAQAAEMMQNPMMQQMMQQMLNDPTMVQQLSAMNPQLGMMLQNPQMRAMLTNPQFLREMTNPNTIRQMEAFNQAMGGSGAPSSNMPGGGFNPMLAAMMMNSGANQFPQQGAGQLDFGSLLGSGGNSNSAPVVTPDPATRYAAELQQLRDMGFSDDAASLQALVRTGGNVNAAVERLLGGS